VISAYEKEKQEALLEVLTPEQIIKYNNLIKNQSKPLRPGNKTP